MINKFCAVNQKKIMAADGELPVEVVQHCERCSDCREFARLWNRFHKIELDVPAVPEEVEACILAAARKKIEEKRTLSFWQRRIFHEKIPVWAMAGACVAMFAIVLTAPVWRLPGAVAEQESSPEELLAESIWEWSAFEEESQALYASLSIGEFCLSEYQNN